MEKILSILMLVLVVSCEKSLAARKEKTIATTTGIELCQEACVQQVI